MSEMVRRAAYELKAGLGVALGAAPAPGPRTPWRADDWTAAPDSGSIDLEALAKLTLLAALDPEDEAHVRKFARDLNAAMEAEAVRLAGAYVSKDEGMRTMARIALTVLREHMAQGGPTK